MRFKGSEKGLDVLLWLCRGLCLLALAAFVLLHSVVPTLPHNPRPRLTGYKIHAEAIAHMKAFTVLISNEGFTGHSRGTGVIIDQTHVLTCAHMIERSDPDMWIFVYPGRNVCRAKPVHVDRFHDLAVLELDTKIFALSYPKFEERVVVGEPITVIGNMLGSMTWMVTYGIIGGTQGEYLLTDGLIHGGNSGGPWINEDGDIVALTDWGLEKNHVELGVNGGVSAKTIKKFLYDWQHPSALDFLLRSL